MPIDYSALPESLRDGLRLYIEDGCPPGSFLLAVLENDLRRACERADIVNQVRLFDIVSWIYNEAPANCWGTPQRVQQWLAMHAERRRSEEAPF